MFNNRMGKIQVCILVVLRMAIGWHFLYEGVSKLFIPGWTSLAYLENANWLFAGFFHWIAQTPDALHVVDLLNVWGLILIGVALIAGIVCRFACICGILLLSLYYVTNPPFIASGFGVPVEGHYLFVNKNLIEIFALFLLAVFPAGHYFAMDMLIISLFNKLFRRGAHAQDEEMDKKAVVPSLSRRQILESFASIPVLGTFAYLVNKKYKWNKVHAVTGATIEATTVKLTELKKLKELKGSLPMGNIGDIQVSRLFLGGNLIGGWAHSRDLIYVSSLFKAYNTEHKVFETLKWAEKAGINTINITHTQLPLINKYNEIFGGHMQAICQIHPTSDNIYEHADKVMENGGTMLQIQGNCCDWRVREGRIDVLQKCIDYIRSQGFPAGLGAHSIQAIIECDKAGLEPDFYMKTIHHDRYWSAHPKENRIPYSVDGERSINHNEFHDNMFCLFPEETIEFMKNKKIPWIGFKVLAAGAIHPKDGFRYAFQNGADFICVGMFDYQIVTNVNIALDTLAALKNRQRPWCG